MRVAVLSDNAARPGFGSEWGLALALELNHGSSWLWDTGQGPLFLENARALGLDPASAHGLALSHGHYDHTGGLDALLDAGFSGPIFAHEDVVLTRYSLKGEARQIGIPGSIPELRRVRSHVRLAPGLDMLADIPRLPGNVQAVDGFFLDREGTMPDPVRDDACLVADTAKGPVLVLGCCHAGLANTLDCASTRLGIHRFHAILGGLHLHDALDESGVARGEALEQAAQAIEQSGAERVIAGHCTGERPLAWLAGHLRCRVEPLAAGMTLDF